MSAAVESLALQRRGLPQPSQPCVAVPVAPRDTTTVDRERPPYAMGRQADKRIRGVPTSATNKQNVLLCAGRAHHNFRLTAASGCYLIGPGRTATAIIGHEGT